MSAKSSAATVMTWNWVMQSLAKFKQVDASTLAGLVKKVPAISDDLGKDTKENFSLRILESLFIHENESMVDNDSAQNSKISFDPSEHCDDVLHKILEETSEPMTELERRKWNVHPFILHKRASLPKTPMQKFKEVLLAGSHPILESLKDMSKLGGKNVSENTTPEDDLLFLNTETGNNKLQESPLQKFDHVEDISRGITEDIGKKECEMTILPPIKDLEENTMMDHVEHIVAENLEQSSGNANVDHGQKLPLDDDDDERIDIAAKKEAFISSQFTLSQDFMATVDFTEICVCMKCNKGGELLICNSDACQVRVHENCLGPTATFDENGNFLCPFCAYSHAISKFLKVKKKAFLARKDFQAFLSSGVKHRPKRSSEQGDQNAAVGEKVKVNGERHTMNRGKEDCAPPELAADSLNQPTQKRTTPSQQYNEKESPVASVSRNSKRTRKCKPQYTSYAITLARRKKLPWTKSEEEILKEGIQRFSSDKVKKIPWKEILDFGRNVFDKSRTRCDLKDKWRNISKERPTTKKPKLQIL